MSGILSSTNVKDAFLFLTPEEMSVVLLEPFLLVGGFGATNLLMVSFLEVRLAGGRPSTSKFLFLDGKAGLSARGVSVEAIYRVSRLIWPQEWDSYRNVFGL